jgi:gamma-glutamyltranspeptidase/glutathione hydrolase
MVAADSPLASKAGTDILRQGGNAVDAAVATAFALAVVRPSSTGIGGGGFLVLKKPGEQAVVLDFRETAPAAVDASLYLDRDGRVIKDKTVFGHWAVGVPGTVAGLSEALEKFGTMRLDEVAAPAVRLAEDGFVIDPFLQSEMETLEKTYGENPAFRDLYPETFRIFLKNGKAYKAGERIRQPELAETLKRLGRLGADDFYKGETARAIVAEMKRGGGPITENDLLDYKVRTRPPLEGKYRDLAVFTMPPPSSGGAVLLEILNVFDQVRFKRLFGDSPGPVYYHFLAECMKHAFADRALFLGDSDLEPAVLDDVRTMISAPRAERILAAIDPSRTKDAGSYGMRKPPGGMPADGGTCHFSVLDKGGTAVACTFTINLTFGSLVAVPGTGVLLNNEMDDFTVLPGEKNAFGLVTADRNKLRPGARPLSSMTPTIMTRGEKPVLIIGGSGGPRIISGTLQVAIDILEFGMRPGEAVAAPRIHHQWMPDVLRYEEEIGPETRKGLDEKGHRLEGFRGSPGHVQVIFVDGETIYGASDPRKGGRPDGE